MHGCGTVFGLILLVITVIGTLLSYASPFWIRYKSGKVMGLWATCEGKECTWIFEVERDNTKDMFREGWFIAVQGMMSVGVALSLFSLLTASISMCCRKESCSLYGTIGGLLLTAFFAMCVALILFIVKVIELHDVKPTFGDSDVNSFGWSFWVAVGATVLSLGTSGVYRCATSHD